ncbi:MAG: hypothetical protein GVY33_00015, partial [Alphaproteobacteria bacterium]|nr:hypothetical protein [Alphaproteobacteria bacterium]
MSSLAPWYDRNRSGLAPQGTRKPQLSTLDTISQAVRYRSPAVGAYRAIENRVWAALDEDDPSFDWREAQLPARLEPYRNRFGMAQSQDEFDRLKDQIDRERRGLEQVGRASGGTRFLAETVAAVIDPVVLVPPAKAATYGARLSKNLLRYGAAETAMQTVQMGTGRQEPGETLVNIGAASALGGVLGSFVGKTNPQAYREVTEGLEDLDRTVDDGIAADGATPGTVRQGPVEFEPDGTVSNVGRRTDNEDMSFASDLDGPAGVLGIDPVQYRNMDATEKAKLHQRFVRDHPERSDELFDALGVEDQVIVKDPNFALDLENQQLAAAGGLEKIPVGPLFRLSKASVELPEIQRTIHGLTGLEGMFTRGNLKGRPTETGVYVKSQQWKGRAVEVRNKLDRLFLEDREQDPQAFAAQMRLWWRDGFEGVPAGKLDRQAWTREVTQAVLNHGMHPNRKIAAAAAEIRKLLDEMGEEAKTLGIVDRTFDDLGQEGYLPRVWRLDVIEARRPEFVDRLAKWWNQNGRDGGEPMAWDDAVEAAERATDDIIHKHDPFHRFDPDTVGQATSAYSRKIDAPSSIFLDEAGDFFETNVEGVIQNYARAMGTDIELARRFGSVSMKEHLAKIKEQFLSKRLEPKRQEGYKAARDRGLDHNQAMAEGNKAASAYRESAEYQQALKQIDDYIQDLRDTRDRVRGTYGIPDDPFRPQSRAIRVA